DGASASAAAAGGDAGLPGPGRAAPPTHVHDVHPPPPSDRLTFEKHDLDQAAAQMIGRFTPDDLAKLKKTLTQQPNISVGTICSGTDLCKYAIDAILSAASESASLCLEQRATATSRFACEKKKVAQAFLQVMHDPTTMCLFADAGDLRHGKAFDIISSQQKPVPGVSWVLIGFCCQSVSLCNINSADACVTIRKGDKKTGQTFKDSLAYIARFRPALLTLENVTAIDNKSDDGTDNNLDEIVIALHNLGYAVLTLRLDARDHGVPQRRNRQWILGFLMKLTPLTKQDQTDAGPMLTNCKRIIYSVMANPMDIDKFLLEEGSAELALFQGRRADISISERAPAQGKAKAPSWPEKHREAFRTRNLTYPPVIDCLYGERTVKNLGFMPKRSQECVVFMDLTLGPIREGEPEEIIDVNQSISRIPRCTGSCPCITPNALLWLRKRQRLLEGPEIFALQGMPWFSNTMLASTFPRPGVYTNLGGNAYNAYNVMAIGIGMLTVYERALF
ncbi:unnamed protein product, partial [Prorocentrum cordatum]